MANGLQVWDSDGDLILDTNSIVFKELGTFTITSMVDGSYTDSQIAGKNIYVVLKDIQLINDGVSYGTIYPNNITLSGNTFSWNFDNMKPNVMKLPTFAKYRLIYSYGWLS